MHELWRDAGEMPEEFDGPVLVLCESADETKPLVMAAWYHNPFGFSCIMECWIEAITHWIDVRELVRHDADEEPDTGKET